MDTGIGSAFSFVPPKDGEKWLWRHGSETEIPTVGREGMDTSFAILGDLKIPIASQSKGLGMGKTDFGIIPVATKTLSKRVVVHRNLGYTFLGEHRANNELNYCGAVQLILSDKWSLVGEIVGVNNFKGRNGDGPLASLFGTQYLIKESIVWDEGIGIGIGMNKAVPDFRVTTGLTVLFKP